MFLDLSDGKTYEENNFYEHTVNYAHVILRARTCAQNHLRT